MPQTSTSECPVGAQQGVSFFLGSWVVAALLSSFVVAVFSGGADDVPIGVLAFSAAVGWTVYACGAWLASKRAGSGDVRSDFGISAAPIDAVGLPLGVAAQLALIPLIYAPLKAFWPDTFDEAALTETAEDLVDRADGAMMIVLALVVVVGAPLAEELFYRGLLQRPLLARAASGPIVVVIVVGVAVVFALIHFRPVEYPGLFGAGLVFGVCAWRTGRLAMSVAAHVAFNATALVMATSAV